MPGVLPAVSSRAGAPSDMTVQKLDHRALERLRTRYGEKLIAANGMNGAAGVPKAKVCAAIPDIAQAAPPPRTVASPTPATANGAKQSEAPVASVPDRASAGKLEIVRDTTEVSPPPAVDVPPSPEPAASAPPPASPASPAPPPRAVTAAGVVMVWLALALALEGRYAAFLMLVGAVPVVINCGLVPLALDWRLRGRVVADEAPTSIALGVAHGALALLFLSLMGFGARAAVASLIDRPR